MLTTPLNVRYPVRFDLNGISVLVLIALKFETKHFELNNRLFRYIVRVVDVFVSIDFYEFDLQISNQIGILHEILIFLYNSVITSSMKSDG